MRFAGFRPQVRFLLDLGFAYIDDGARSFRMDQASFGELLAAGLTEQSDRVVQRYPTVFQLYDSKPEAEATHAASRFA